MPFRRSIKRPPSVGHGRHLRHDHRIRRDLACQQVFISSSDLNIAQTVAFILVIAALSVRRNVSQEIDTFALPGAGHLPAAYRRTARARVAPQYACRLLLIESVVTGPRLQWALRSPCSFASIRERLQFSDCEVFRGFPIALITAALMAMAFMGFSGLKVFKHI